MEEVPKAPAKPQLEAARFHLAEHERNVFSVTVEPGLSRKDILDPGFFAHVASKCRPYDEIIVRCDDGTMYARLLVLQAERTWVRVHVLEWHDLTTRDVARTQEAQQSPAPGAVDDRESAYEVKFRGPHLKWCVMRKADAQPVREHEDSKQAAQHWLTDWLRVTA